LQFGDVNLLLDLEPKDTIVELVQERGGITIDNIKAFSMVHSSGVSVLCAPKSAEFAELVSARHVETIIDVLRPYYDFIILDLPPAFNDVSIAAVENCDELMLIYNLDILSLKNAKVCLTILDQIQQREKAQFIINKNINSLIKVKDFEAMFETPVFATISNDVKSANICLNKGQPIVVSMPRTPMAKEIVGLAQKILRKT
jgi:pilus assembly protein CpaE